MNNPDLEEQRDHLHEGQYHKSSTDKIRGGFNAPSRIYTTDFGDRVPPQRLVSSGFLSATSDTALITPGESDVIYSTSEVPPARRYVVYGDTDSETDSIYQPSEPYPPKRTQLISFWASVVSLCISLPMCAFAIYLLANTQISSTLTIACTIAITFASISLTIEMAHLLSSICPKFLQLSLGRHAMLHCMIASFSILSYMQHQKILGHLFVLNIIPACLFYTAKARRETILSKI